MKEFLSELWKGLSQKVSPYDTQWSELKQEVRQQQTITVYLQTAKMLNKKKANLHRRRMGTRMLYIYGMIHWTTTLHWAWPYCANLQGWDSRRTRYGARLLHSNCFDRSNVRWDRNRTRTMWRNSRHRAGPHIRWAVTLDGAWTCFRVQYSISGWRMYRFRCVTNALRCCRLRARILRIAHETSWIQWENTWKKSSVEYNNEIFKLSVNMQNASQQC